MLEADVRSRIDHVGPIVTPDQRLRVFVSSTLQELAAERVAATEAIEALRLTPVLFELGARPHPPQTLYRAYLEQSQLFVGMYWQSYGWVAPGESISGIEDEYRLSAGLPRLLYVKRPAPEREPQLAGFLERVKAEGSASYRSFSTAEELSELLARDLAVVLTERFHATAASPAHQVEPPAPPLPAPRTSFVGREPQLERIEDLLAAGTRLVTLTGPGGIGKTRLAVEAARNAASHFPDGLVFVPLDGLDDAALVPAAIAEAVGVHDFAGDSLTALAGYLKARRALLVLDNFEHVVIAAPVVGELLERAPGLTVLATSRELLRLSGEHEIAVPPLPVEEEAVALFAERAAAARHAFELTPEDVPLVAEICRRLDGVPLAIELAAPRMRLLTPSQLLDRLSKRLELSGPRDAPARQRTLEATIGWSYELLTEDERRLFERLSVFHGSFSVEAAEELVAALPGIELVDALASLLDKSIVYRLPHLGETRFAMLRMIRDFAGERLRESGRLESTLESFVGYYGRLADEAWDGLSSSAQRQWKKTLDLEADNFRAVLSRCAERGRGEEIARVMRGLWIWFWLHGNLEEGRDWVELGLSCADELDARDRGWLLGLDGMFTLLAGEFAEGIEKVSEAESLLRTTDDRRGLATTQLLLSFGVGVLEGEEVALAGLRDMLETFEELGDLWGIGSTLHAMTRLRVVYDDYEGAGDLFERGVETVRKVGDELGIVLASGNLAMARLAAGDTAEARRIIEDVLERRHEHGVTYAADDTLDILARIEHADHDDERSAELLGAADRLRAHFHTPLWPQLLERHERLLGELRASLGDAAFEAACERGAAVDSDDARDIVLGLDTLRGTVAPS